MRGVRFRVKDELADLLAPTSYEFIKYMPRNWYTCINMWSDCERSDVFSALNTTTNKVESGRNRVKKRTHPHTTIDQCVEGLLDHEAEVLTRELKRLVVPYTPIVLRPGAVDFVRDAMRRVSDYVCDKISKEASRFSVFGDKYKIHPEDSSDDVVEFAVGVPHARDRIAYSSRRHIAVLVQVRRFVRDAVSPLDARPTQEVWILVVPCRRDQRPLAFGQALRSDHPADYIGLTAPHLQCRTTSS